MSYVFFGRGSQLGARCRGDVARKLTDRVFEALHKKYIRAC
jgi:hypothetical protein